MFTVVDVSLGPGRHNLLHVATIYVSRSSSSFVWKGEVSSSRDFAVVPASEAAIRLIGDPSLADRLRDTILPRSDLCHHGGGTFKGGRTRLIYRGIGLEIVRPMPVSVAFDVFVIVEDTEHHAGTVWCEKGSTKAE